MPPSSKSKSSEPADPKSFEEALARLQGLVDELESGNVPLEQSLQAFEQGQLLIKFCRERLTAAEVVLKRLAPDEPDSDEDEQEN